MQELYPIGGATTALSGSTVTLPHTSFAPRRVGTASNTLDTGARTVTVALTQALAGIAMLTLVSTSTNNPLPRQLTAFMAVKHGANGLLRWNRPRKQT